MLKSFSRRKPEQSDLDKIGYCCRQYYIRSENVSEEEMKYYNIAILSDIKRNSLISEELKKLKECDFTDIGIISKAPVRCIAFMENDRLVFVTYSMFENFKDALSAAKLLIKQSILY